LLEIYSVVPHKFTGTTIKIFNPVLVSVTHSEVGGVAHKPLMEIQSLNIPPNMPTDALAV
jgi:hypothetical protein